MSTDVSRRLSAALLLLTVCIASPAFSGDPGVGLPLTSASCPTAPVVALITPAGQAASLADQNATIYVQLLDGSGTPVVNYPHQDIWLFNWGAGTFRNCAGGSIADAPTDAAGQTTISGAISGGGWSEDRTQVMIAGAPPTDSGPLLVHIVSPDITGDLIVDLADIGEFSVDFYSPGRYVFRSDFKPDGGLDLSDIAILAVAYGEACP